VVWLRVLSRTNLPYSSRRSTANPRLLILLQTLCRSQRSQLLWNQANPNSFAKTPGVGCTSQEPSSRISNLQTLRSRPVCKSVTPPPSSPRPTLHEPRFYLSFVFIYLRIAPPLHRFSSPLFSWSYELLFQQLPSFHKHLHCPLLFSVRPFGARFRKRPLQQHCKTGTTMSCPYNTKGRMAR
jgi:hypothetical protein